MKRNGTDWKKVGEVWVLSVQLEDKRHTIANVRKNPDPFTADDRWLCCWDRDGNATSWSEPNLAEAKKNVERAVYGSLVDCFTNRGKREEPKQEGATYLVHTITIMGDADPWEFCGDDIIITTDSYRFGDETPGIEISTKKGVFYFFPWSSIATYSTQARNNKPEDL